MSERVPANVSRTFTQRLSGSSQSLGGTENQSKLSTSFCYSLPPNWHHAWTLALIPVVTSGQASWLYCDHHSCFCWLVWLLSSSDFAERIWIELMCSQEYHITKNTGWMQERRAPGSCTYCKKCWDGKYNVFRFSMEDFVLWDFLLSVKGEVYSEYS